MNILDPDLSLPAVSPLQTSAATHADRTMVIAEELRNLLSLPPYWKDADASVYILPDAPWVHRASQCLNAFLARLHPDRANAVLRPTGLGKYEAKIQSGAGADARRWMIDPLPAAELDHFIQAFSACRWGALRSPVFRAWQ